jgi:hypothetical protein
MTRLERARKPDFTGFERLVVALGKLSKVASELPPERPREPGAPVSGGGAIQRYTPTVERMLEAARQQQLRQADPSHPDPLAEEAEGAQDGSQTAEKDCLPHPNGGGEAIAEEHERLSREIRAELEAAAETGRDSVLVVGKRQRPIGPIRYSHSRLARPKGRPGAA